MRAGDTVRFRRVTEHEAQALEMRVEALIANLVLDDEAIEKLDGHTDEPAILSRSTSSLPGTTYRAAGDKYMLIEYGDKVLDLSLRLRVHLLEKKIREADLPGVIELTPGVRSLQVHYGQSHFASLRVTRQA